MNFIYTIFAYLTGRNLVNTPVAIISDQMNEPRQLPLGAAEFEEWSDRIISGVPPLDGVDRASMQFALATMVLQLGPQESHKPDIYFLKSLLKTGANQVAHSKWMDLKKAKDAQKKTEEAASKAQDDLAKAGGIKAVS